jgi:hypothetical protein
MPSNSYVPRLSICLEGSADRLHILLDCDKFRESRPDFLLRRSSNARAIAPEAVPILLQGLLPPLSTSLRPLGHCAGIRHS